MVASLLFAVLGANLVTPPKQPEFGIYNMWRATNLRGANELLIRKEYYRDMPQWVWLYGIELPQVGSRGYSGARQDLEVLLGRAPDVYIEDEREDHPVTRNGGYVQYVWTRGKLIQFELVRDGWAKVNDEGRKGRYSSFLTGAEAEAKRFHEGLWAN